MPDTFTQFTVKRGSDGSTFPTTIKLVDAGGPYVADDTTTDADPAQSPTKKWFYTVDETTNGGAVVPYNTVKIDSVKQGTCQKVWQINPSGQGNDCYVNGLKGDSSGNTIGTGWFDGTANFGGANKTSSGSGSAKDIFLVSYDSNNQIVFYNQYGNGVEVEGNAVVIDSNRAVIVTGVFQGADVNLGPATSLTYGNNPYPNVLVAKYSASGSPAWAVNLGVGTGNAICRDANNDCYVFRDNNFGSLLIQKLSGSDGSVVWTTTITSDSGASALGIALSPDSASIYVTGSFFSQINLGSGLVGSGGGMFIGKYSASNRSYSTKSKIVTGAVGRGIAIDPHTGNVVVTGGFTGSRDFGGGNIGFNGGIFLAGYDSLCQYLWAKNAGYGNNFGSAVAIDSNGNLAFTGTANSLYFGPGSDSLPGNGAPDYFVAGFTISGNSLPVWKWSKLSGQLNATGTSAGQSVGIDAAGRVFTGGWFNQIADFGDGFLGHAAPLQAAGFLAQYSA